MKYALRWNVHQKVSEAKIKELEKIWQVKLPQAYLEIVSQHDDGMPQLLDENGVWKPAVLDIPGFDEEPMHLGLLSFMNAHELRCTKIFKAYLDFRNIYPNMTKLFPFADDGRDNLLLFDYVSSDAEPRIAYYEFEDESFYDVCNSFSELLERIYPASV